MYFMTFKKALCGACKKMAAWFRWRPCEHFWMPIYYLPKPVSDPGVLDTRPHSRCTECGKTQPLGSVPDRSAECTCDHTAQKKAGWDHCPHCKVWL